MAILEEHTDLLEAIRNRQCILFLGAGISSYDPNGLPTGAQLAHDLASRGKICKIKRCDYYIDNKCALENRCRYPLQRVAQYYELQEGRESLISYLEEQLMQTRQPLKSHKIIAGLHRYFRKIITTNHDRLLEEAYPRKVKIEVITEDTKRISPEAEKVVIIKMHGCISRCKETDKCITITENDYYRCINFLMKDSLMVDELKRYLRDFTVIFIGYSLEDSTFRVLFHGIKDYLGGLRKEAYAIQHEVDPLEQKYWWEKQRVKVLDVDLLEVLEEINQWVNSDLERARERLGEGLEAWGATGALLTMDSYRLINSQRDALEISEEAKELMLRSAMSIGYDEFRYWADEIGGNAELTSVAGDLLNRGNDCARYNSIKLLSDIGVTKSDLPRLVELLNDPNRNVKGAAADAIARSSYPETAGVHLFESLKRSRLEISRETSEITATTFCRLDPDVIVPLFRAKLGSEEEATRTIILEHFRGRSGCASQCVAEALKLGIVDQVLDVLATIGDNVAVAALESVMVDVDASAKTRIRAIRHLGNIRTMRATGALGKMLKDEDERMREEAIRALGKIASADSSRATGGEYIKAERARRSAIQLLQNTSELPAERVRWFKLALEDLEADGTARAMALEGLRKILPDSQLLGVLTEYVADRDDKVHSRAAQMLADSFGIGSLTASLRELLKNRDFETVNSIISYTDLYEETDKHPHVEALLNDVKAIEEDALARDTEPSEPGTKMLSEVEEELGRLHNTLEKRLEQLRRSNDV